MELLSGIVQKTIIMKLGGSVLLNEESYQNIAEMLDQLVNQNNRIYCVLSARKGRTDELINECDSTGELARLLKNYDNNAINQSEFNNAVIASKLLQGEIDSVNELSKHLTIPHRKLIQGQNFPVIANSNYLNAVIQTVKTDNLMKPHENLILVPGFGAENNNGEQVLLGRNASDLIAILLSQDEQVNEVIYVKDVPGVYANLEQPEIIHEISNTEIRGLGIGKVLDNRIYEWQRCNIRVTNLKNQGTLITI